MNEPLRPAPARLLALDPGEARIGVAVSDELGMLAHPRPAIPGRDRAAALRAIAAIVAAEGIREIVVGLPLSLSGERGPQRAPSKRSSPTSARPSPCPSAPPTSG
ncbi:RuvX/YqgF family protein [Tepidiforma flava]|uniref:RuvX/YqgF family protein n=1 Tax=Tepidiforma flava TaxID=3004094 RepID=A0ABY7M760_9CHLR|nr:RuvX/YqgF family protein [Tepidiforma flava]